MIDPRTLRGRLGLGYAIALLAALTGFAIVTLVMVDRTQRAALDQQLAVAVRTLVMIPDVRDGRVSLDSGDVADFRRVTSSHIDAALLDAQGRILVASAPLPKVAGGTTALFTAPGNVRVEASRIERNDVVVGEALAWHALAPVADVDRRLAIAFGIAIPTVAVLAIVLGGIVVSRALRPLTALAALASEIEANDLSARIGVPSGSDELARLCATFDKMLGRLEAAFERQRRFTSDASHELRAPLSVIRAEADLMIRKQRTPEEYERALRSIAAHADELEALVRDLLAAARAEAVYGDEAVDVREVADAALQRLAPLARARGVRFVRDLDEALVRGDAAALRRALQCVVHNALTFSPRGAAVSVEVGRRDGTARIVVSDAGPGFSAEALEHATERFWRDEHVRSNRDDEAAGSGLGLSIVEAIVRSCGGLLQLDNRPRGGAVVTIMLPAPPS
ncbi:MAG TPA: ATP-binding protein [Candidatus Elarobacter sp.]|jgi:signal transduction histidine kinase|nr:ATP-binding protein [Candidatus Elarobacter sp.]